MRCWAIDCPSLLARPATATTNPGLGPHRRRLDLHASRTRHQIKLQLHQFRRAEVEGKGTWYRLQVTGFSDKAAAQDVCNKLKANGQACIITTAK